MAVERVGGIHSGSNPYLVQVMKDPDVNTVIRERYSFPDLWILVMDVVSLGGNPNADCGQGQLQNDHKMESIAAFTPLDSYVATPGVTRLHVAARYRQFEVLGKLIAFGGNPEALDKWGEPPMT